MVAGNRGELFALDLSFIGWWILTGITFGIASIYVVPYYFTTQALYYENFKLRALQEEKLLRMIFFRKSKERLNMLLQVLKTAIKTITITTIKAIITTILIIVIIHKAVLKRNCTKSKCSSVLFIQSKQCTDRARACSKRFISVVCEY